MLKINLLTERRDAEKEYRKMLSGASVVNYLALHVDTTVRRRVHQNIRNDKKKVAKRERQTEVQWARRRAKSRVDLLSETRGPERRDGKALREVEKYVVDRFQRYSRCHHCGKEFVTPSGFAFCGESLLKAGDCKKAWLITRPVQQPREPKFNMVTPEDADHAKRTRPMMPRPSNLGHGRGSRPLPPNTAWVWDNEVGYRLVNRQK